MPKLVEVKYFEPAKGNSLKLGGYSTHPARYRYCNCWVDGDIDKACFVSRVGAEGCFRFEDRKCSDFLGEYQAEIIQEVESNRYLESDRFELAEEQD